MREAVKDFIERVITDDYTIIRVEANDMLPKVGTKNELLDNDVVIIDVPNTSVSYETITGNFMNSSFIN